MRRMILVAVALMLMTGCALVSRIQALTPKQKATIMMDTFVMELRGLQAEARFYHDPMVTPEARLIMRYKMALLQAVYPLIKEYVEDAEAGREPDLQLEHRIFAIIGQIVSAAEEGAPPGAKLADPPPAPTQGARILMLPQQDA